jgi:hypothetical protein
MPQSTFGRIWNRLASRYEQDTEPSCREATIEEVPSESAETDSDGCCEWIKT